VVTISDYIPATEEGLELWSYAVETARLTGRVIFGQLWLRDPSFDDMLQAAFLPSLEAAVNRPSPLVELLFREEF